MKNQIEAKLKAGQELTHDELAIDGADKQDALRKAREATHMAVASIVLGGL